MGGLKEKYRHLLTNNWFIFALLVTITGFNGFIYKTNVMTRDVYFNLMSDRMETERIAEYFNVISVMSIWSYLLLPLFLLVRYTFLALLLQVPFVIRYIEVKFSSLLKIVMLASFCLVAGDILKTVRLLGMPSNQISPFELALVPLSLLSLLSEQSLTSDVTTVLSQFNLFEFGWISFTTIGLSRLSGIAKLDSAIIVTTIWMLILLFQWLLITYIQRTVS